MTRYHDAAVATIWPKTLLWAFFATPDGAARALRELRDAVRMTLVSVESAAIVEKDAAGTVSLREHPTLSRSGSAGAGLVLGGLLSLLFPEVTLAAGLATTATAVRLGSHRHDAGSEAAPLRAAAAQMPPNSSALFALASRDWVEYMNSRQALDTVARYVDSVASSWGWLPISEQLANDLS